MLTYITLDPYTQLLAGFVAFSIVWGLLFFWRW